MRMGRSSTGERLRPLPEHAEMIFRRLARDVEGLTAADVALVELAAYWLEIAKECRRQLAAPALGPPAEQGERLALTVTDTAHGNQEEARKNPLLIVLRTATEQVRAICAQLGASPMARARLPEPEPEQMSLAEILFADVANKR